MNIIFFAAFFVVGTANAQAGAGTVGCAEVDTDGNGEPPLPGVLSRRSSLSNRAPGGLHCNALDTVSPPRRPPRPVGLNPPRH